MISTFSVQAKWDETNGWTVIERCDTEEEAVAAANEYYENHFNDEGVATRVRSPDGDVIESWGEGRCDDGNPY